MAACRRCRMVRLPTLRLGFDRRPTLGADRERRPFLLNLHSIDLLVPHRRDSHTGQS